MKKFMLVYLAPVSAEQKMDTTPEQMAEGMKPWMEWHQKHGDAIVDMGTPVGKGWNMKKEGKQDAQTQVAGYSIVQAVDAKAVEAILENHPHFMIPGTSIEVLEYLPMPGM